MIVDVNGQELYFEEHGAGRPLVLLHGGLQTIDLAFGAVLPALAESHRVIAVELQGHGHTPDTDRELTLPNLAADVTGLLDVLELERADLFGFSLGGLVATQVAISYPERVGRLVLASAHFRWAGYHSEIRNPEEQTGARRMPTADEFEEMHAAYVKVAPDPERYATVGGKVQPVVPTVDNWELEELRGITAPTLLLMGDTDFLTPEHGAWQHELLADARLAILPGTTHTQVLTRTEVVLPIVRSFLAE
jgi:pimeloyl-ACP methyl ester carboxylesterase